MSDQRFRVNTPRVAHETVGGEVIVIDLTTGSYFSAHDAAAEVWSWIERSPTVSELVDWSQHHFEGAADEIEREVRRFMTDLAAAELIAPEDANGAGGPSAPEPQGAPMPFGPLEFVEYTDMQDLMLLDPVHEVDATGWPPSPPSQPRAEA